MCNTRINSISGVQKTEQTPDKVSGTLMKRTSSSSIDISSHKKEDTGVISLTDDKLNTDQKKVNVENFNPEKLDKDFVENITEGSPPVKETTILSEKDLEAKVNMGKVKEKIELEGNVKPSLEQLQNTPVKVDMNKLEALDNSITEKSLSSLKEEHNKLSTNLDINSSNAKIPELSVFISEKFGGIVEKLDSKLSKDKVYTEAKNDARQRIASFNPNSQLIFNTSLLTDDQLKEEVAKSIGMIKDKHQGKTFDQLPENKQKLVNAICEGIKNGLPKSNTIEGNVTINGKEKAPAKNALPNAPKQYNTVDVPSTVKISGKEYTNPVYLGEGGVGRILKYTNQTTGESVVVKEVKQRDKREEMVTELKTHRHAMGMNGNPNVVNMKGFTKGENDSLYMIMDEAKGGDMRKAINNINNIDNVSEQTKALMHRYMLRDVLKGMDYVQSQRNMLHLDLKPENFLMDENGKAMVADFGGSKVGSDTHEKVLTYTPEYGSPEVASRWDRENAKLIDQKSDTWTVGMMINEITGGKLWHFSEPKKRDIAEQNIKEFGNDDSNRIRSTSDTHKNLDSSDNIVNALMHPDPTQRPSLKAALEHNFFQDPILNDPNLEELMKEIVKKPEDQDVLKIDRLSQELDKTNPSVFKDNLKNREINTNDQGGTWTKTVTEGKTQWKQV